MELECCNAILQCATTSFTIEPTNNDITKLYDDDNPLVLHYNPLTKTGQSYLWTKTCLQFCEQSIPDYDMTTMAAANMPAGLNDLYLTSNHYATTFLTQDYYANNVAGFNIVGQYYMQVTEGYPD